MSNQPPVEITENDIAALRLDPDALAVITALLGVKEMGPEDHIQTKQAVRDWLSSGDLSEARALISSAARRRERWRREHDDVEEFPSTG